MMPSRGGAAPRRVVSRVRLSPSAGVARTPDGVILRSDLGTFQIAGPDVGVFLDRMVPLLDGSRDEEAIVRALGDYARPSVTTFLDLLRERGLVEVVPEGAPRWQGQDAFFRSWGASAEEVTRRLAAARVLVAGLEPWTVAAAVELASAGVGILRVIDDRPVESGESPSPGSAAAGGALSRDEALAARIGDESPWCRVEVEPPTSRMDDLPPGGPWRLLVAGLPGGDVAEIAHLSRLAHRAGVPSLWSHLSGTSLVLGPLVTPGRTACRVCAMAPGLNPPLGEGGPAPAVGSAVNAALLGHMIALEVLRELSEYAPSDLGGRVLIEDPCAAESEVHELVRLPWCRICGD